MSVELRLCMYGIALVLHIAGTEVMPDSFCQQLDVIDQQAKLSTPL